ncbi:MAG: oxaloacetate decarboxylase [Christensenellales bacterium]
MNPLTKPRVPSLMELCEKEQILAPCIWDCRTAHAAELAGFKAILLSGGELAESVCGVPDIGLITADDLVQSAARISQYSVLPVIVDADDGFGDTPLAVYRLIKRLIEAGAKGCTLDDTTGIRGWNRWGSTYTKNHSEGKDDAKVLHQSSTRERRRLSTDFVVIARTECKLESGLDEAILRCQMARELGAPMTMINCIRTLDEAKKIAEQDKGHKMWPDIRSLNGVPDILLDDIGPMGFSFVTCHFFEKAMMYGASDFAKHIVADRTSVYSDQHTMGGMTKEEQRRWIDLGLDPWLDAEAVFTDLSELREKHPGELDGDPLAY